MPRPQTDLTKSLEQLNGWEPIDQNSAETPLMANVIRASKKPLNELSAYEIGMLVVQHYGYPYLLDLLWPKIEADPLFDGGYYPGDVLSNLIRGDAAIWTGREQYRDRLPALYQRALARPLDECDAFRDSLQLPTEAARSN